MRNHILRYISNAKPKRNATRGLRFLGKLEVCVRLQRVPTTPTTTVVKGGRCHGLTTSQRPPNSPRGWTIDAECIIYTSNQQWEFTVHPRWRQHQHRSRSWSGSTTHYCYCIGMAREMRSFSTWFKRSGWVHCVTSLDIFSYTHEVFTSTSHWLFVDRGTWTSNLKIGYAETITNNLINTRTINHRGECTYCCWEVAQHVSMHNLCTY